MNRVTKHIIGGLAAFGTASLGLAGSALAGSITQPGEIVGYLWSPLPEGFYFATTGSYGNARGLKYSTEKAVNVPLILWSTPWSILGARVEAYVAVPSAAVGIPGTATTGGTYIGAIYNPYGNVGLSWDLGHGFGLSTFVGTYAPVDNALNQDFWTFNSRTGITWAGDGWNLSGHVVYGVTGNNLNTGAPFSFNTTVGQKISPNYVNIDLSALKSWGKWSFGPVAYGSWDVSSISYNPGSFPYGKQSQFAVGGLVGYDFGPVVLQSYLTRDVASRNYVNNANTPFAHSTYETRLYIRAIVPLWTAPQTNPVVAKY